MKIEDIVEYLKKIIPIDLAEPWDNVGLQCGDKNKEIKKIVIALDPSTKAINYAIQREAQLLITHHPLIFSPLKRLVPFEPVGELLITMIKQDIGLFVMHTNLDSIPEGVSDALLFQLNIKSKGILSPKQFPNTGFGRWGEMPEVIEAEQFIQLVKQKLQCSVVRVIGQKEKIKKIGVCGGSAGDLIPIALDLGLDAFVIGEIKYHPARLFENIPMLVLEVGHYESEKFILKFLKEKIEDFLDKQKENVEILIFEEVSPFKYY